jgi:hypothetical protein
MQPKGIIAPVSIKLIRKELTRGKFIRHTNHGGNQIYCITAHDSPNTMQEIGRIREMTFRSAGGGTGQEVDIDEFDTCEIPYKQLIVWNPKRKEIVGGYRFIIGSEAKRNDKGEPILATSHLFHFSDKFMREYMPYTIELGRSFIQPNYQSTGTDRRGLFALDNIWDGLGSLTVIYPKVKFFFGKVTMYPDFNRSARNLILFFLKKYFGDKENLITPIHSLNIETPEKELEAVFTGESYLENYKILSQNVRQLGENIPPLINSYMNLSPTMKVFGTALNPEFGNVEETGLLITISDIYSTKKDRHILTFKIGRRVFKF